MRRTMEIKSSLAAIVATVVITGCVAWAQDLSQRQSAHNKSALVPVSSGKVPLGIGDRLKISFFETIDVKPGDRGGVDSQGTLHTFYQRMDLSGEYAIEVDGAVSIPLLGRFQIEGHALDDVRADLSIAFTRVTGRSADVNVTIIDRPPVYVVGPVKHPGAYKYVPGMIVLHAIALAGGLDQGDGNISGVIEGVREMERLRRTSDQVKRLLARRARLEAERDGVSSLPMPIQLAKLVGEDNARTFLATEAAVLQAEQAKRQQQENEIVVAVNAARNELEALKRKLQQIDLQKDMRVERLNEMQKLKERGVTTTNNVIILRTELSDIEARRQDYLVTVVQAEARLAQAEETKARLMTETAANLTKAIATVDQEIADAQDSMAYAGMLAGIIRYPNSPMVQTQTFEIVRQLKDSAKTLQASETSSLMPGDVLKINVHLGTGAAQPKRTTPETTNSAVRATEADVLAKIVDRGSTPKSTYRP